MKKLLFVVVTLFSLLPFVSCKKQKVSVSDEPVVLRFGSWRTDDVGEMEKLFSLFHQQYPNITVSFEAVEPTEYNDDILKKLKSETAPDLICVRSYATGESLYNAGYLSDCSWLTSFKEAFSAANRSAWTAADGKEYAVPFAAVSHGMYYNRAIFQKEELAIPRTWEEFLQTCETLKSKGYVPIANGLADKWDIFECFFLGGVVPDFVGGANEREKYEKKRLPLNDDHFVAAYQAMADIATYLPGDADSVSYDEAKQRFIDQKAVMIMDGSWSAGVYGTAAFDWGIFALPAPKDRATIICFHPDMAISMNTKTLHQKEARSFLLWLCTVNGAESVADSLPSGYFPVSMYNLPLADINANRFLRLNKGRDIDARFIWPKLVRLYEPMKQAVVDVVKGKMTPRQAADFVAGAM
mgnify:CR=1 FL=1